MAFDVSSYLGRSTGRAKSDVANKLVSMLLHELSRKIPPDAGVGVRDAAYTRSVAELFGTSCAYCGRILEADRAAVELPDGMNRFRLGLHIAGNVVVACTYCNRAKRHEDQRPLLTLASSGWEAFLKHDSTACASGCNVCGYWKIVFPDETMRKEQLGTSAERLRVFRAKHRRAVEWNDAIRPLLKERVERLYRDGQEFALNRIRTSIDEILSKGSAS